MKLTMMLLTLFFSSHLFSSEVVQYKLESDLMEKNFYILEFDKKNSELTFEIHRFDEILAQCSGRYKIQDINHSIYLSSELNCSKENGYGKIEMIEDIYIEISSQDVTELDGFVSNSLMPLQFIHPQNWTFTRL